MDPAVTQAGATTTPAMRVDAGGRPDVAAPLWLRIPDLDTLPPATVAETPTSPRASLVSAFNMMTTSAINGVKTSAWAEWAACRLRQFHLSPVVVLVGIVVVAGILLMQLRGGDEADPSELQSAGAPSWEVAPGPAPWRGQPDKSVESVAEPDWSEMQGPALEAAGSEQPTAEFSPWSPPEDAEISVWPRNAAPSSGEAAASTATGLNVNPHTGSSIYTRGTSSTSVAELDGTIRKSTVR
ncbi:MAG: hypothetical protein WDZ59_13370 [Pirellulales bacterium]